MSIEEDYKLLLQRLTHQKKYDPGLEDISILNAPDVIGEGLGEEAFLATEGRSPEVRATLATIARMIPDAIGMVSGLTKGVYDAAKRGWYDDFKDIPSRFKQSGAIHGYKSTLAPKEWMGPKGKGQKMLDEGASVDDVAQKSYEETGFMVFPMHKYKPDGSYNYTDWGVDVPNVEQKAGKIDIEDIANFSKYDTMSGQDVGMSELDMIGYPSLRNTEVTVRSDQSMLGASEMVSSGKGVDKGKHFMRLNDEIADIEESLGRPVTHGGQHLVDNLEVRSPGGTILDKDFLVLSGEVRSRASENQWDTITDLKEKGLSLKEIRDDLVYNNPIYKTFDVNDMLQINKTRQGLKGGKLLGEDNDLWQSSNKNSVLGTHQYSGDNAKSSIREQGLANPSIGISTVDNPGDRGYFGKINLIANDELITPSKEVQVFSDDAYTTTYPNKLERLGYRLNNLDDISHYMTAKELERSEITSKNLIESLDEDFTINSYIDDLLTLTPKKLQSLDQVLSYSQDIGKHGKSNLLNKNAINDELDWLHEKGINKKEALKIIIAHRFKERSQNMGPMATIKAQHELGIFKRLNELFDEAPNTHGYIESKPLRVTEMDEYPAVVAPSEYKDIMNTMNKKFGTKIITDNLLRHTGKFSDATFEELDKLGLLYK